MWAYCYPFLAKSGKGNSKIKLDEKNLKWGSLYDKEFENFHLHPYFGLMDESGYLGVL